MGIYIKDMEIPTGFSAWTLKVWPDGQVEIFDADGGWKTSEAVSVPPHGRCIDADALLRGCKRIEGKYATIEFAFSQSAIENATTILEAEEGKT